jgi:hypothetical protein
MHVVKLHVGAPHHTYNDSVAGDTYQIVVVGDTSLDVVRAWHMP